NANLSIYQSVRPITLPYYDSRMCGFICSLPVNLLKGRQIQIEYIKRRNPKVAKVSWQAKRPFNLYNYKLNKMPYNLPFRVWYKVRSKLSRNGIVQRNWELQFMGKNNDEHLREWLF